MAAVPMASMEKVEERARQEEEVWQSAENVRGVLGDEEEGRDDEEPDEHHAGPRFVPPARIGRSFSHCRTSRATAAPRQTITCHRYFTTTVSG